MLGSADQLPQPPPCGFFLKKRSKEDKQPHNYFPSPYCILYFRPLPTLLLAPQPLLLRSHGGSEAGACLASQSALFSLRESAIKIRRGKASKPQRGRDGSISSPCLLNKIAERKKKKGVGREWRGCQCLK